MARLERGVRPIGFWSTRTSRGDALHAGGDPAVRFLGDRRLGGLAVSSSASSGSWPRWRQTSSTRAWLTRLDLPEPETPITAVMTPSGKRASSSRRLLRGDAFAARASPGVCVAAGAGGSGAREQVAGGVRTRHLGQAGRWAAVEHPAAALAGLGADVDQPVGAAHHPPGRARPRTANCRRGPLPHQGAASAPRCRLDADPRSARRARRRRRTGWSGSGSRGAAAAARRARASACCGRARTARPTSPVASRPAARPTRARPTCAARPISPKRSGSRPSGSPATSSRGWPLRSLGLGYLALERSTPTLSPGELQRLRLATQVRSNLFGVVYVLDEPSAGPASGRYRSAAARARPTARRRATRSSWSSTSST